MNSNYTQSDKRKVAFHIAENIYKQCLQEERRLLRAYDELKARFDQCQQDKIRYGKMIGVYDE
jgi:hypothetical protein